MKKRYIVLIGLALALIIIFICTCFNKKENTVQPSTINNKDRFHQSLAMMYETAGNSGQYEMIKDGEWPENGFVYNEKLSKCKNGSKLSYDEESNKIYVETNTEDMCYVYFDRILLTNYVKNLYTTDGENGLYYHDGKGDYTNYNLEAGDNSYRYAGGNPANYVCFGSDASTCPTDNLYRIIGVFDNNVKLIKADYANSNLLGIDGDYNENGNADKSYYKGKLTTINTYYWNKQNKDESYSKDGAYTNWTYSDLNNRNLNENFIDYLNKINRKWSNVIVEHSWNIGKLSGTNGYYKDIKNAYDYEVGSKKNNLIHKAKIGLMYVSDYYYATSSTYWTYPGNTENLSGNDYRKAIDENWMYMGIKEWTISSRINGGEYAFHIAEYGAVGVSHVYNNTYIAVRPTFYLKGDVKYISGTGTEIDPYRIA